MQVLEIEEELDYAPEWVCKARFRRGQAQARKRNFDLALADFRAVLELQPEVISGEIFKGFPGRSSWVIPARILRLISR
jgi:predicted TPR repeat methyltransferase